MIAGRPAAGTTGASCVASPRARPAPNESVPPWVRDELRKKGYTIRSSRLTSGPINAIYFDREHGTMWGGSSNHGEDYGIAW